MLLNSVQPVNDVQLIIGQRFSYRLIAVALRRGFLVLSVLWVLAIPLAAFAAGQPAAPSAAYGFALAVYSIGRVVCHQLPARSFHLLGMRLPVCARCSGIYLGAATAAVVFGWPRRRPALSAIARGAKAQRVEPRWILLAAFLPTAATLVFEWTTGVTPANWIRALAGLPLGAAVAWAIAMVN
jgi:hypothetical protein